MPNIFEENSIYDKKRNAFAFNMEAITAAEIRKDLPLFLKEHPEISAITFLNVPFDKEKLIALQEVLNATPHGIKHLGFSSCEIDDETFECMANIKGLDVLKVTNSAITDAGAVRFAKAISGKKLKQLDVQKTHISRRGLAKLYEHVPDITSDLSLEEKAEITEKTVLDVSTFLREQASKAHEDKETGTLKRVAFFTHVLKDGYGDIVHTVLTAKILKKHFPSLKITIVGFVDPSDAQDAPTRVSTAHKIVADLAKVPDTTFELQPYSSEAVDTFLSKHHSLLSSADLFMEVSYRVPQLTEKLKKEGLGKKKHFFIAETSIPFHKKDKTEFQLFDTQEDINGQTLRLGMELGFRFDDELEALKIKMQGKTFQERLSFMQSETLREALSHTRFNDKEYTPYVYMGYFRKPEHLVFFLELFKVLHGADDLLNVFVKETPDKKTIEALLALGFSDVQVYGRDGSTQYTKGTLKGPSLRLFATTVSYSDSNVLTAMSHVMGSGGDCSYFQDLTQGLVDPAIPFLERMPHDGGRFFRYLLFLIDQVLPDSVLYQYFEEMYHLTSRYHFSSSDFFKENHESIMKDLQALLLKKEQLKKEYTQFCVFLKKNHNMETILAGISRWQDKNAWYDSFGKDNPSYASFWAQKKSPSDTSESKTAEAHPSSRQVIFTSERQKFRTGGQ